MLGVNLPWLLLGVLSFPFLFGVGWAYVRWAERNEQDFTAVIRQARAVNPYVVPGLVVVVLVTVGIGAYGLRFARTTSDFLVASRSVSPTWNAAAISGEYLSAASFLGVAGLVLRYGVDVLWYPVGFAAGYLALLLFVAAPLRRSGAFTLPDFCEVRLRLALAAPAGHACS